MTELRTLGRYRVEGVLGRGAMGIVYRGRDPESGAALALKTVRADLFTDDEREAVLERMRREAEIGMALRHPGVVRVFDFAIAEDSAFLAMELVDGEGLERRLAGGRGLPWREAVDIVLAVLAALDYVHAEGVVHRDLKPANIMLLAPPAWPVKLIDFGVAHLAASDMTRSGYIVGTPAFMAPEQLEGRAVDARSDLFSLGAVLYFLLTGTRAFSGSLASVMHQLLHVRPEPPSLVLSGVPASLDPVVGRALEKAPEARYASAAAFAAALRAATRSAAPLPDDSDATIMVAAAAGVDAGAALDELERLLEETSRRVTEKLLERIGALADTIAAHPPDAAARARAVALCVRRGLVPLHAAALAGAPLPGARGTPARGDFIATVTLMARLRRLVAALDPAADTGAPVARLAAELRQAVMGYATRLSQALVGDDSPDIAAISPDFLRLDVLRLGLETLGADDEVASLGAIHAMLAHQVMAKINAVVRSYTETNDALARFGVATLLAEIEELIVLAERLVDRRAGTDAAGRRVVAEFIAHAGTLAGMIAAELAGDVEAGRFDQGAFAGRLKQLGFLYLFAVRLDDEGNRAALRALGERARALMVGLTDRLVAALAAALGADDRARARAAAGQIAALHALAAELGWEQLGRRLMIELRDRVIGDPALRALLAK